jgi:hypothetical protein
MSNRYQGHLRTREYREFKQWLASEWVECHERGCTNRALTPDHDPPISTFPDQRDWVGILRPHCRECSNRQSGLLRWQRKPVAASREW